MSTPSSFPASVPVLGTTTMPKDHLSTFTIISAYDQATRGIGYQNQIPWHVPEDMRFFRITTTQTRDPTRQNAVIMGRRTLESLPEYGLPGRFHVCLSRSLTNQDPESGPNPIGILYVSSLDEALHTLGQMPSIESIYVIGGAQVYQEAMRHPQCERILVNELELTLPTLCDTFFPEIDPQIYTEELVPPPSFPQTQIKDILYTKTRLRTRCFRRIE
jgi:dihydrofolate reductase